MEKINIVFLDEDSRYLDGISRFIQNNYSDYVNVICFNDVEKTQREIIDTSLYNMLVVSSSLFNEAREKINIKNICILIERNTTEYEGQFKTILKYQSGNNIYKEIMNIYESINKINKKEIEVMKQDECEVGELEEPIAAELKDSLVSLFKDEEIEEVIIWSNKTVYIKKNNNLQIINVNEKKLSSIRNEREEIFSYIKDNGEYTCHGIKGDLSTGQGVSILFINKDIEDAVMTIYKKSINSKAVDKKIALSEKVENIITSNENLLLVLQNNIYEKEVLDLVISRISSFNRVIELTNEIDKRPITIDRVNKYIVNGNDSLKMILDSMERKLVRDFDETLMDILKVNSSSNKGMIYVCEGNSAQEFIDSFEIRLGIKTNLNFKLINKILLNSFGNIIYVNYEDEIIKNYKLIENKESNIEVTEV